MGENETEILIMIVNDCSDCWMYILHKDLQFSDFVSGVESPCENSLGYCTLLISFIFVMIKKYNADEEVFHFTVKFLSSWLFL